MYRVAIVGRPNVGKSTLFNRLTKSRKAIVGDLPGITRDRMFEEAVWDGKRFEIIDTGGIIPEEREEIPEQIFRQAEVALEESDLILLVVDGRDGVTPLDESLNAILRSSGREFLLVVNKIDTVNLESLASAFYALGVDKVFPVSAEHANGMDPLLDEILGRIPVVEEEPGGDDEIRVAIIGRPNMGKSSLLNRLSGHQRVIVSAVPGTTRDAIDTVILYQDRHYRLVDTAGIRRKGKTQGLVEKMSVVMARRSIERADVVLLLIDAVEGATHLDATIGGYAHDAGKSLIIVVNKWDLIQRDTFTSIQLEKDFRTKMRFLDYAPMIFVSALTGQRVFKLLELARRAYEARFERVPTGELNKFVEAEVQPRVQSSESGRKFPVLYLSQVGVAPPTFVLFTRTRKKVHFSLERFLANQLRERYGFYATPIRIRQRIRQKSSARR